MTDANAMAACAPFVTYMRRMLGAPGSDEVFASDHASGFSARTRVVVVPGGLSVRERLRIRRSTSLTRRFTGGLVVGTEPERTVPVDLYDCWDPASVGSRPASFDVLAIVTTFNEGDVIGGLLARLRAQGVRVHVIDNWSHDGTADIVSEYVARGGVALERFPAEGPSNVTKWEALLVRVEEVARSSGADWVIHHDADEVREPPWRGLDLPDAFWAVEQWGYNCVDHTVVDFRPIDNSWRDGGDVVSAFRWCEFGSRNGHFVQLKAWKPNIDGMVLAASGGHVAVAEGRRIFPYKFLLRHYPIRSQAHGERKVLRERHARWSPEERARGWHTQYEAFDESSEFLWRTEDLFDWHDVDDRFVLQRLSGAGLPGNPNPGEGPPAH